VSSEQNIWIFDFLSQIASLLMLAVAAQAQFYPYGLGGYGGNYGPDIYGIDGNDRGGYGRYGRGVYAAVPVAPVPYIKPLTTQNQAQDVLRQALFNFPPFPIYARYAISPNVAPAYVVAPAMPVREDPKTKTILTPGHAK